MSEDESLDMQDIQRFIAESDLPAELKKRLNESLPMLLENVSCIFLSFPCPLEFVKNSYYIYE